MWVVPMDIVQGIISDFCVSKSDTNKRVVTTKPVYHCIFLALTKICRGSPFVTVSKKRRGLSAYGDLSQQMSVYSVGNHN